MLRLLDKSSVHFGIEEIGLSPDQLRDDGRADPPRPTASCSSPGPTGSGKTTTLYAALSQINSPDKNIITIEDPVEYQLGGIGQIQVNPKIGLTFAHGLRSVLRHDPDVILVGEIRDVETAEIAIQAAMTGHLVFSTLHTNDAASAVTRLIDMGIEPFPNRFGRPGDRWPSVCSGCSAPNARRSMSPEAEALRVAGISSAQLRGGAVYRGQGLPGLLRDRIPGTDRNLRDPESVRRHPPAHHEKSGLQRHRPPALEEGMKTLRDDGARKFAEGATTLEELLRVSQD